MLFRKNWSIFKSIGHAFCGIWFAFLNERSMRIHVLATIAAILFALWLKIGYLESLIVLLSISLVWVTELINTSVEESFNIHSLEKKEQIKIGKDIAAGAVLIASINALFVGGLIFIPKILMLLK